MTYHSYIFLDTQAEFYKISQFKQHQFKKEFLKELRYEENILTYTYATIGLKADTRILLWFQAEKIEEIQAHLNKLLHTNLGHYLKISFTLFGMTRPTQYSSGSSGHLDTERKGGAYLIIYPFTKTYEWYMLSFEERKELMKGHIAIGRKHPQITQLLLYSYGVDDSEFIVSYETDDLSEFQMLVMDLRSDPVRKYTLKDTPIFTCLYKEFDEVLEYL